MSAPALKVYMTDPQPPILHWPRGLQIWTIYRAAEGFDVRGWRIVPGEAPRLMQTGASASTLSLARMRVPFPQVRMDRTDEDHPSIVESWI